MRTLNQFLDNLKEEGQMIDLGLFVHDIKNTQILFNYNNYSIEIDKESNNKLGTGVENEKLRFNNFNEFEKKLKELFNLK